MDGDLAARYDMAIEAFVGKVRDDPNVVAVLVSGSVSQGTVWAKSDVDMTVVVRDQKLDKKDYGIYEDEILINVMMVQRSDLKRSMEKSLTGSIGHHFGTTCRIVFTKDDDLHGYFDEYGKIGKADAEKSIFLMANTLLYYMEKVEKWLVTIRDPEYARLYLISAADAVAQMEACSNGQVPTREAILQAKAISPALMGEVFTRPMSGAMTDPEIREALKGLGAYVDGHLGAIESVADDLFGDGEIKTGTQIANHFRQNMHMLHPIMDYLCEKGYMDKVSQTIRLTPKGRLAVEEMAFIKAKA
ncbi:MAG: nucleotidyltransferase [Oscillospiraceae bacterium]|nr:nucleotidyltransferase [Oscillospiraceae bacterium]